MEAHAAPAASPMASLAALSVCLGQVSPTGSPADLGPSGGQGLILDEVMDDFIEEHSQSYDFREHHCGPGQDRYFHIFQALQRELCWLRRPIERPRALRVLQCLRLLTRDAGLQTLLFEGSPPTLKRGDASSTETSGPPRQHGAATERGRERPSFLPPTAPATSSRALPHPPTGAGGRPGLSASPRRSKWRSPDGRATQPVSTRRDGSVERQAERNAASTKRAGSMERQASIERQAGEDTDAERIRLPPLEMSSPRGRGSAGSIGGAPGAADVEEGSTPSSAALLRLLSELVAEYLAAHHGSSNSERSPSAAMGHDMRTTDVAVAGFCVIEIVSMLNRYATTEPRRSRLAKLGALRPLASLLSGATDVVLRCALETLVHFTMNKNAAVLGELAALSLRDPREDASPCPLSGYSAGLLRQCLGLLGCQEETFEGLAAQLLEQLLEAPELRAQLRRSGGALPIVVSCLRVDVPERSGHGRERNASLERRRAASPTPRGAPSQVQIFKRVRALHCCQKLARDHVEVGDPQAVQQLRDQGAFVAIIALLRHNQKDQRAAETLLAALETLAQMCMDDDCALGLRSHFEGIEVIGALLLDLPWRPTESPKAEGTSNCVQRAAARLLRFVFAVERNRKAFKHILPAALFGYFIDIGNYVWPLDAYVPFVGAINSLAEKELAQVRCNYMRSFERGMMMRRVGNCEADGLASGYDDGQAGSQLGTIPVIPKPCPQLADSERNVGGYVLVECVGAGAFGRVHLARKNGESIDFALKEVPLMPLSDSMGWPAARQPKAPTHTPGPHGRRPGSRCSTPRGGRGSPETTPTLPEAAVANCPGDGGTGEHQVAKDISREVQLLRQLDHPNIVRYYDSFIIGTGAASTLWIAMEFCSGVSLQSFTVSKKEKGFTSLPEEQTWQIFVQLSLALRYLHIEKRIAHRDLTPNNVLVQANTLATKIADFGLARQKATGIAAASMMRSMVGTILYSCPEIVQHKPYTHKTDVWAVGCLLYKMATLSDPFSGSNPLTVARKIVECDYAPLDPRQHSEMLINTCKQCLTVTPEARPDIRQVCQLITPALVQHIETLHRTFLSNPLPNGSCSPVNHRVDQHPEAGNIGPAAVSSSIAQADVSPTLHARNKQADQHPNSGIPDCLRESGQSIVSQISEYSAQSVQTALSVQSKESVQTAKSVQSEQSARSHVNGEQTTGTVQVPRHMLGTVVDPLQRALQIVHQLAFLSKLPLFEGPFTTDAQRNSFLKQRAVLQYQQWLLGSPQGAAVMKREVSRLMQRSTDRVDCLGPNGEAVSDRYAGELGALSQLTYEVLHRYMNDLCALQGYDAVGPSSPKGGSSSSDAYNVR